MVYIYQKGIVKFPNQCDNIAVLSPTMYWFIQKSFPFDNKRKIEKIVLKSARNSFENANAVFCYKVDSEYFCFCYDKKALEHIFEQHNLSIEKIFFATTLYFNETTSIEISESLYLNPLAKTFFESSNSMQSEITPLLCEKFLEKEHIKIVKNNHTNIFTAILILATLGFLLNVISWIGDFNVIEKQQNNFTLDSYRTQALMTRYENTQKTQEQLRNSISQTDYFLQLSCKGTTCEAK